MNRVRSAGKFIFYFLLVGLISCSAPSEKKSTDSVIPPLFKQLDPADTRISFANNLQHTERVNTYTYRNFYNGAGVAAGDINNDGLIDLYFAGNQADNKLYLNKGNFVFEDITEKAGLACADVWSTGVSMADVNGDGWLDIYVCKSGPPDTPNRNNELFINNGDLTFTERSQEYGVADKGLSNHAAFFDYDRDGDLDMYLLNNSLRSIGIYDLRDGQREIRDPEGGNKLYRNDGDHFTDVSEEAGIYGSAIGFGLGVTIADINKDQWPDIFVSNDFFERDYLYVNNQDGTFSEVLTETINEISMGSMGADIADINNDTYPDIYVSEMLPAELKRVKTKTLFEDWDKYQSDVRNGYYHQFTRNAFQINNGPIPGNPSLVSFSEISRMTKTHATDWSWGALLFDADNNGFRDIFVANGIFKDLTDQDYVNFYSNNEILISRHRKDSTLLTTLIEKIPSVPIRNFLFLNNGELDFSSEAKNSGFDIPGFSNGAVYADLDNDGDLDLVLNNINEVAGIFENLQTGGNYLQLQISGPGLNTYGFGTQVYAYSGDQVLFAEQFPVKGYMSSMDPRLHLGLGDIENIDSLVLLWPDGLRETRKNIQANQILNVTYPGSGTMFNKSPEAGNYLLSHQEIAGLDTVSHHENNFNDFNRDRLLYEMYSNEGPAAASGDINQDGLDDLILGGSRGYAASVFLQQKDGSFTKVFSACFEDDKDREDIVIKIFDANSDGLPDLYVGSGSSEFAYLDFKLKDRIYLNSGNGTFMKSQDIVKIDFPSEPTGFVEILDFDNDGDPDIIAGSRSVPFKYGQPASAHVWLNEGNSTFKEATADLAPGFFDLGLLTSAASGDFNGNDKPEIVIAGEWMKPAWFEWNGSQWIRLNAELPNGIYKTVQAMDLNGDGSMDLVFGNYGTNTRLNASPGRPLTWNISDYDGNGQLDHILSVYDGDSLYPLILLQDLSKQLPVMRKRFQTFDDYKDATTGEVLNGLNKTGEVVLTCEKLASYIWLNDGSTGKIIDLPWQAQLSPVYSVLEIEKNGTNAILLGGNQTKVKPELGSYNASYGTMLKYTGDQLEVIPYQESGFWVRGEVREMLKVRINDEPTVIVVRNNDTLEVFR